MASFALFDLVGKQLSPRIRDLGKITLDRTGGKADFTGRYPLVGPLRTRRLNTELITGMWVLSALTRREARQLAGSSPTRVSRMSSASVFHLSRVS
ncbi:TnpA family transposase [Catenuloplanes nepalensis]|uniref:TnpA family transposase n=1 Tax=Catenuloplanes nepalensis TaxID=587533 RepID=A0ABT9MT09_9ACTN|nr:TnpA family transposase [Catenuloplanes nepalensis]